MSAKSNKLNETSACCFTVFILIMIDKLIIFWKYIPHI
nr:MAG TPA: hypothetical protein [Caudoviricetes sp.]